MAKRFGRNQKRKLLDVLNKAQHELMHANSRAAQAETTLQEVLRDQLYKGKIPLEVEHFLSREGRGVVMHAMFDRQRSNLHYQHNICPEELQLRRNKNERERFGMYLGRAIADRIADAYTGAKDGSSTRKNTGRGYECRSTTSDLDHCRVFNTAGAARNAGNQAGLEGDVVRASLATTPQEIDQ